MEDAQHGNTPSANNITAQWKKVFPPHVTAKKRWRLFNVFSIIYFFFLLFLALEVAVCPEEQVVNTNPGPGMR